MTFEQLRTLQIVPICIACIDNCYVNAQYLQTLATYRIRADNSMWTMYTEHVANQKEKLSGMYWPFLLQCRSIHMLLGFAFGGCSKAENRKSFSFGAAASKDEHAGARTKHLRPGFGCNAMHSGLWRKSVRGQNQFPASVIVLRLGERNVTYFNSCAV
jgi:hypothetical protein